MMASVAAQRFRSRLLAVAAARRFLRSPGDVLTIISLAFVWLGLAMVALPLAFVITGCLLMLLTPVGAALRILLRGR